MKSAHPEVAIKLLHEFDLFSLLYNISPKVKALNDPAKQESALNGAVENS